MKPDTEITAAPTPSPGSPPGRQTDDQRGMVLFVVLTIALIAGIVVSAALGFSHTAVRLTRQWRSQDECLLLTQSALEKAKWDIYQAFQAYFDAAPLAHTRLKFPWFDSYSDTWIGSTNRYNAPQGAEFMGGKIWIQIADVQATRRPDQRLVLLKVRAQLNGLERRSTAMVSYEMAPSPVFDYAYFINNFGWFWGSTIYADGEVRANGNFSFRYNPKVNGEAYGAYNPALSAEGDVNGSWTHLPLGAYYSYATSTAYVTDNGKSRMRPGDPPSLFYDGEWPMGYTGNPTKHEHVSPLDMPYIGNLSDYEYLARQEHGSIKIGSHTVVNEVYNGPGPDGVTGTADDGTLVLVGTRSNPIRVTGPVVVSGDVIIKGVITGQGTIYSGRNVHIVGSLTYKNPPSWDHPDNNPEETVAQNASKDLVGLAAKGNIILGDYMSSDWQRNVARYIHPNFTQAYDTDPSDADIGYDSDHNSSNGYRFNGDYTAYDGGQKIDRYGRTRNRKYYECSNEEAFRNASPTNTISRVDAVCYTNHLFGGRVKKCCFDGAIVSRDEAIIFNNWIRMNWDIRLGSRSPDAVDMDIYLPRTLHVPRTVAWREF